VAVRGACLILRKPHPRTYSLAELVGDAGMSSQMSDFLTTCVAARRNLVVCGAPGAGKSAVLAALAAASPAGERVVTVEDVAELSLGREAWVALEARPGDGNGVAPVDLGMVLRSALRMRADRLVVGEVRGGEVLELVSAMASSIDGALVSVAGEGARAALARLTVLARLGAPGATTEALQHLVASAVDVVVHVARYADGVVRIAAIEEVQEARAEGFETREVFAYRGASDGGRFAASGVVPAFYSELGALGISADTSIFRG
jgi:pilus assembly protein CpaF